MTRSSLPRLLLLVFVAALLAAAAGCGGSSGSDDSASGSDEPDVTESTTEDETMQDETTSEDETTTEDETMEDETTTEDADEGDSGDANLSDVASAENCRDLGELSQALSQALSGQDVDVDRYSTFLNEFADRTPEEIRSDFQVLADAWSVYAGVIGDLDLAAGEIPSAAQIAELQQAFADIDQEEITEASTNIGTWVQENCTP